MCLFITLAILLVMITIITLVSVGIGGAIFVIVFGDLLVFIFLIRYLINRKK